MKDWCSICKYKDVDGGEEPCIRCAVDDPDDLDEIPPGYKPYSNLSRITVSVETLAKFIVDIADCNECEEMHGFRMCDAAPDKSCDECWMGWLSQEAKE